MAKRYDAEKNKLHLAPPWALAKVGEVFTMGAEKYGEHNWERGMEWSRMIASLERHINAFKRGEDFDDESGLPHMAHAATNALMLLEYHRLHPMGDDRQRNWGRTYRVALDVDEVCADFVGGYIKRYPDCVRPGETSVEQWNFDPLIGKRLHEELAHDDDFWLSLKPRLSPTDDIPFEPACYVTSRVCSSEITAQWLAANGFPYAPVVTVGHDESKLEALRKHNIDMLVDDRYENFCDIMSKRRATQPKPAKRKSPEAPPEPVGVDPVCFLWDAPHNRRYEVGHWRIKSLHDLPMFSH